MSDLLDALIHGRVPASLLVPRGTEAPTERQAEILDFVIDWIDAEDVPPSFADVCEHFGFRSTNAVHDHYSALERKGYLERVRAKTAHNVRLTPLARAWSNMRRAAS